MVKRGLQLISALIILFVLGEALLLLTGLLPQEPIRDSIEESLSQLEQEYEKPYVLHDRSRSAIGNFTDCLILNLSYYGDTQDDPLSILSNPYNRDKGQPAYQDLTKIVAGQAANTNYLHYCMGFRIWMRLLLSVFNFMEIRSIFIFVVWLLFGCSLITVYRATKNGFFSALYILSIVALNPIGVSGTLSYMDCFIIAFLGVILVPKVIALSQRNSIWESMLFLVLGAVTQFFDFYTYPLITFAFPMIVLLSAKFASQAQFTAKDSYRVLIRGLAAWIFAYVGIWGLKLLATALLTNLDVLNAVGIALQKSLGVASDPTNIPATFVACAKNILSPEVAVSMVIVLGIGIVRFIRNPNRVSCLKESWVFLVIGALSLVWIVLAKRTLEHVHFQYRTLGVLLMGCMAFLAHATGEKRVDETSIRQEDN
jgi:hypothetical protein